MRMTRFFAFLGVCLAAATMFAINVVGGAIDRLMAVLLPFDTGPAHLHLVPGTPRSIMDTRRMGLA